MSYKVPGHIRHYVIEELRLYDQTKKHIEFMRDNIILGGSSEMRDMSITHDKTDSTGAKVEKLLTTSVLYRMQLNVSAIDRALDRYPECVPVFELHFRRGFPWYRVRTEAPMDKNTFFAIKRRLIYEVAKDLGMF